MSQQDFYGAVVQHALENSDSHVFDVRLYLDKITENKS